MVTEETCKLSMAALDCLKEAVIEELRKKALLGQYAIINRDGKACRVPASEALRIALEGK